MSTDNILGWEIVLKISQPRTLSADIPAAWRGLFTKYFLAKWRLLLIYSMMAKPIKHFSCILKWSGFRLIFLPISDMKRRGEDRCYVLLYIACKAYQHHRRPLAVLWLRLEARLSLVSIETFWACCWKLRYETKKQRKRRENHNSLRFDWGRGGNERQNISSLFTKAFYQC